jgi:trehalose 6-phosphate synthase
MGHPPDPGSPRGQLTKRAEVEVHNAPTFLHNPDAIADALHSALTMPLSERKQRHTALLQKVMSTTAQCYRQRFVEALLLTIRSRPHSGSSAVIGGEAR